MLGFFRRPAPAEPALPFSELGDIDAVKLYAACLLGIFLIKALLAVRNRSVTADAARKGASSSSFVPLVSKNPAPPLSKGRAVVIGGGGFLGRHIVDQLLHHGYAVHVFDMPGGCVNPRPGVTYAAGDITSTDQLRMALDGAALVVHAAAAPSSCRDARTIEAINVEGTRAVLAAAKSAKARALVYTSAAAVVFEGEDLTDVDERQPYAAAASADVGSESRARAEAMVLAASTDAFSTVAIRPAVLYGPCDDALVPGIAAAGYSGASRYILGSGKNFADFCYAENAAFAHALAADALLADDQARRAAVAGRAFFVTDGDPQPFWTFTGKVAHGLGYSAPWLKVPAALGAVLLGGLSGRTLRFATTHHTHSTEAAKRRLGYEAPVSTDAAVGATVKAFAHLKASALGFDPIRGALELVAAFAVAVALVHAALTAPLPPQAAPVADAKAKLAEAIAPLVAKAGPGVPHASLLLLAAGLALLWTVLCLLLPNAKPRAPKRVLPPTIPGVPVLGNLVDFLRGPLDLIAVARRRHRDIFTLRIGPQPITFCCHPSGYETFGRGKDDVLDQAAVYGFTIPAFGRNVVYDAPLDKRLQQIKFVAAIMNTSTMRSYVPKIIMEATEYFDKWGDEGKVELHKAIAQLTTLTASRCLHGHEVRETLCKEVADLYHDIDGGMQPISTIAPRLPIAAHRRRDAARKELASLFGKVIDKRKAAGVKGDDILQVFIDARYTDGTALTNDEITGLLITLLFAGQHTSSITGTWLGMNIVGNGYLPAVYAEQKAAREAQGGELNYDALMGMSLMRQCITETLRLYPPLIFLMRKVIVPRETKHWTIPKGHILAISPREAGRDERVFPEAESFKPERFGEGGQAERLWNSSSLTDHEKLFSYMAFGTGPHMCLGRRFAYLQLSIIWAVLADKYDMEVIGTIPPPDYDAMVVGPKGECWIRYKRRVSK